jgi:hypothetical protein
MRLSWTEALCQEVMMNPLSSILCL